MTQAMSTDTQKQLRQGKVQRGVRSTIRHLILIALSVVWLVPIVWLVVTSFSGLPRHQLHDLLPRDLYAGQLHQRAVPPRQRGAVPPVVCQHLYCGRVQLRDLHLLCADGGLRLQLLPVQKPAAAAEPVGHGQPVPRRAGHDRRLLRAAVSEPDQLLRRPDHGVRRVLGPGLPDLQGLF